MSTPSGYIKLSELTNVSALTYGSLFETSYLSGGSIYVSKNITFEALSAQLAPLVSSYINNPRTWKDLTDTADTFGSYGQIVFVSGDKLAFKDEAQTPYLSGLPDFRPSGYSGYAGQFLVVDVAGGITFSESSVATHDFLGSEHNDVNTTTTPEGGDTLVFNGTTSKWEPSTPTNVKGIDFDYFMAKGQITNANGYFSWNNAVGTADYKPTAIDYKLDYVDTWGNSQTVAQNSTYWENAFPNSSVDIGKPLIRPTCCNKTEINYQLYPNDNTTSQEACHVSVIIDWLDQKYSATMILGHGDRNEVWQYSVIWNNVDFGDEVQYSYTTSNNINQASWVSTGNNSPIMHINDDRVYKLPVWKWSSASETIMCTMQVKHYKQNESAPNVDFIHLAGNTSNTSLGYLDATQNSIGSNEIWDSVSNTVASNWSTAFNGLTIDNNVTKTELVGTMLFDSTAVDNDDEELCICNMTIDWINNTIKGHITYTIGNEAQGNYYISSSNLTGIKTFIQLGIEGSAPFTIPQFQIVGRSITKLPKIVFDSINSIRHIAWTIKNYKTVDIENKKVSRSNSETTHKTYVLPRISSVSQEFTFSTSGFSMTSAYIVPSNGNLMMGKTSGLVNLDGVEYPSVTLKPNGNIWQPMAMYPNSDAWYTITPDLTAGTIEYLY